MAEQIVPHALTTVERVKARLGIDKTSFDALFMRIIGATTDYIESACDRRFKETTYTDEIYTILPHQKDLILKNIPVASVATFQFRAGTKTTPAWTDYQIDSWELRADEGIIHVHGEMVGGVNVAKVTYTAGYKIDFTYTTTHNLPMDLSELCERLAVRTFKRREAEGKDSESFDGSTVKFLSDLTAEDKATIAKYSRVTFR